MNKKRKYLIPTLMAAGFTSADATALPLNMTNQTSDGDGSIAERLRLQHKYYLAGHRSHSSHSSHRSSSGGGYVPRVKTPTYVRPKPKRVRPTTPSQTPSLLFAPTQRSNSTPPSSILPSSPKARQKTLPGNSDKFKKIVMQVQLAMNAFGYYQGAIDGVIGPKSKIALASMQKDFNLKVTGTVTPELLNVLGITAR